MHWIDLERQLEARFVIPKLRSDSVDSWRAEEPVELEPLIHTICENEDEEEALDDNGVRGFLVDSKLADGIMDWSWDSMGPMTQSAFLDRLDLGQHSYLVREDDWAPYRVIARFEEKSADGLSTLFVDLLAENGYGYADGLFGSIPAETSNFSKIPESIVREAYGRCLDWQDENNMDGWSSFLDEVAERIALPNPYERVMTMFETLPDMNDPDAVRRFLDPGEPLTPEAKKLVMDEYFSRWYA